MDAIITMDDEQRIVLFNATAEHMFRCCAADVIGQSVERLMPARFRGQHAGHIRRFGEAGVTNRAMGKLGAIWGLRADGEEFPIEASISHVEAGSKKLFTVILRDISERQRQEARLLRLAAIVDSSDDAILSKNPAGNIISWNRGAERLYGYTEEEMIGRPATVLIPPSLHDEEKQLLAEVAAGRRAHIDETTRVCKDGSVIRVSVALSPVKAADGQVVGAASIARDISERLLMVDAVRESQRRLASILESAMDAVIAVDENQRVVLFNAAAEKMFGCPPGDAKESSIERFIPEKFRAGHAEHIRGFAETGVTNRAMGKLGAIWGVRSDGEEFPIEASISQAEAGGRKLFTVILRDITERKRSEEALAGQAEELSRQAEELVRSQQALEAQKLMLQSVLDSIEEGLVATDDQGKFILWNPAAEKIVGMGPAEMSPEHWNTHYGVYLPDTLTPFPPEQNPLLRAIRGEMGSAEMFLKNRNLDGGVRIEINGSPLKDKDGKLCGGVVAFRDITERKRSEQERERYVRELQRSNAELEQFAYVASHDLQEPLRMVASYTEILGERYRGKLDADADRYIGYAVDGAQRMQRLILDLLAYARVSSQAKPLAPTDSGNALAAVLAGMRGAISDSHAQIIYADLPIIMADQGQLEQVFQNLINNAIKFRGKRAPRVEISAQLKGDDWTFSVKDSGIGMDMESAGRIFEMFQRLHTREEYEGTGIGLAIAKRIVERHGGRIWCESAPDMGSTFCFTMPAVAGGEV
jgi:PAS domain S-box-containing protein